MNIILTNVNKYAMVHEAVRLDTLSRWAVKYGFAVYAVITDDGKYEELPNVTYHANDEDLKNDFYLFCLQEQPTKICNFIDYLTRWDIVEYPAQKIYFVRSLAAEVIERIGLHGNYSDRLQREAKWIQEADIVVTDSPTSVNAIKKHYNIDSLLAIEYVDPRKYYQINHVGESHTAYIMGRFDKQKAFDKIKVDDWSIDAFGSNVLDGQEYVTQSVRYHGILPFESYCNVIKPISYGMFPAIWESNGYAVQECMAMGKVPIVQINSAGNERLCNQNNSYVVDFNLPLTVDKSYNELANNARDTITYQMHLYSLEKFINILC